MNAQVASPAHRDRLLRALGVVPWRRRAMAVVSAEQAAPATMELPSNVHVVVVLPPACAVRELDLIGRVLSAFGSQLARAARIEATDSETMRVPHAQAYLVFGEAQAHALGRALSADIMRDAHIVLVDAPAEVLGQALSKRRLWHALRSMRRALMAGGQP